MLYIFLDESGDLGFSRKSSKYFVFTLVVTRHPRKLEKIIKNIRRGLKKRYKHKFSELHAYHTDNATKYKILRKLGECDISVVAAILSKEKVLSKLQIQKTSLYDFGIISILDRIITNSLFRNESQIFIVIDRKDTNKKMQENLVYHLSEAMKKRRSGSFVITLSKSHEQGGLQAVDFISWAIFIKYEKGECSFYDTFKHKIIAEEPLFP